MHFFQTHIDEDVNIGFDHILIIVLNMKHYLNQNFPLRHSLVWSQKIKLESNIHFCNSCAIVYFHSF